jgi:exodeoxyribonuclease VII small subunit
VEQESGDPAELAVSFEDALARLETVVAALEKGELTLAESLDAFRDGIGNLAICVRHLNSFEEQVEVLLSEYYGTAPSWLADARNKKPEE